MAHPVDLKVKEKILAAIAERPGIVANAWFYFLGEWHAKIPESRWLWAFSEAGYTDRYELADRPAEAILLYRGCDQIGRLNMSWTPNYNMAQLYATNTCGFPRRDENYMPRAGNVYAHWAWPEELLAHIYHVQWERLHSGEVWKPEALNLPPAALGYIESEFNEYVLDYRYLSDDNVTPVSVAPGNFADMTAMYRAAGRPTDFDLLPIE